MPSDLERELEEGSLRLDAVHKGPLARLSAELYRRLHQLSLALMRWLRGLDPRAQFDALRHSEALRRMAPELAGLEGMAPLVAAAIEAVHRQAADLAAEQARRETITLARATGGRVIPLPIKPAAPTPPSLPRRFMETARAWAREAANAVVRAVTLGLVRRERAGEVADRLGNMGKPPVPSSKTGQQILDDASRFAKGVAESRSVAPAFRASLRRAGQVAHASEARAQAQQMPGLLVRWDAILDGKVCRTCAALNGMTAEPIEPFRVSVGPFPGEHYAPLAHSHCRCRLTVWHPSWNDRGRTAQAIAA